jgi:hypothetical protein
MKNIFHVQWLTAADDRNAETEKQFVQSPFVYLLWTLLQGDINIFFGDDFMHSPFIWIPNTPIIDQRYSLA